MTESLLLMLFSAFWGPYLETTVCCNYNATLLVAITRVCYTSGCHYQSMLHFWLLLPEYATLLVAITRVCYTSGCYYQSMLHFWLPLPEDTTLLVAINRKCYSSGSCDQKILEEVEECNYLEATAHYLYYSRLLW